MKYLLKENFVSTILLQNWIKFILRFNNEYVLINNQECFKNCSKYSLASVERCHILLTSLSKILQRVELH